MYCQKAYANVLLRAGITSCDMPIKRSFKFLFNYDFIRREKSRRGVGVGWLVLINEVEKQKWKLKTGDGRLNKLRTDCDCRWGKWSSEFCRKVFKFLRALKLELFNWWLHSFECFVWTWVAMQAKPEPRQMFIRFTYVYVVLQLVWNGCWRTSENFLWTFKSWWISED